MRVAEGRKDEANCEIVCVGSLCRGIRIGARAGFCKPAIAADSESIGADPKSAAARGAVTYTCVWVTWEFRPADCDEPADGPPTNGCGCPAETFRSSTVASVTRSAGTVSQGQIR